MTETSKVSSTVRTLAGYARNRAGLRELLADATPAALRKPSIGTRWTNEQLLFDFVNYWGSRFAATWFNHNRLAAKFDRVLESLARSLRTSTGGSSTSDSSIAPRAFATTGQ